MTQKKFAYHAKTVACATLVQTFDYMTQGGLEYDRLADGAYRGSRYPINSRSPYLLRRKRPASDDNEHSTWIYHRSPSPDGPGASGAGPSSFPVSPMYQRMKRRQTSKPSSYGTTRPSGQYRTQLCLKGLCSQTELDLNCPNVLYHSKTSDDSHHALSRGGTSKHCSSSSTMIPSRETLQDTRKSRSP